MKTNQAKLVMQSVQGGIHHPTMSGSGHWVGYDGIGRITYGVGGITYNYKIKDNCMNIEGDHVEPGVSLKNMTANENNALMALSCVGNIAKVISGEAKGKCGYVSGKHGGIDHVMIAFDEETLEQLSINDQILIKAYGQGLKALDYPDITFLNLDPNLLEKMPIKEENGVLKVGVTHHIPAHLMGSGLGSTTMLTGDYDIMTQDKDTNQIHHLETLRFGDFVCIEDHYNQNGPHYFKGAKSIGVIVHSDSYTSGHGPGVCILMTCKSDCLQTYVDEEANLANCMK